MVKRCPMESLEEICGRNGVDPAISSDLVANGWSTATFACAALDLPELDSIMGELVPNASVPLLQKAALRAVFKDCNAEVDRNASGKQPASAPPLPQESSASSSWAESFPPKLGQGLIEQLRTKFASHYPSELISQETMPSTRLLSLVYSQVQKGAFAWVPWRYRLTVAKSEEVQSQRQAKMPRIETAGLHQLLVDEPPAIEVTNNGMGINGVRNILAVHDFAVAMAGGAHLASLKAYSAKFLHYLTQRVEPESMLRCASITEAQSADRQIWGVIKDLMVQRKWSMDDCLHEMTNIRHDLPSLLQLRPRAVKPPPSPSSGSMTPSWNKGKGKQPTQGKGKGKPKGQQGKQRVQWITEIKLPDGTLKQLCMRFQTGACTLGDSCKFYHGCGYPVKGVACGLPHGATQHQATSH